MQRALSSVARVCSQAGFVHRLRVQPVRSPVNFAKMGMVHIPKASFSKSVPVSEDSRGGHGSRPEYKGSHGARPPHHQVGQDGHRQHQSKDNRPARGRGGNSHADGQVGHSRGGHAGQTRGTQDNRKHRVRMVTPQGGDFEFGSKEQEIGVKKGVLLIGKDGQKEGRFELREVIRMAADQQGHVCMLSVVAGNAAVRLVDEEGIMEMRKRTWQRHKTVKKTKHALALKEVRFKVKISDRDLTMKLDKAKGFLEKGHPVRVMVHFGRRDTALRPEQEQAVCARALEYLSGVSEVSTPPKKSESQFVAMLRAKS